MCHCCSHRVMNSLRCIDDDLRHLESKKSKLLAKKMCFARLVQHCCEPSCCQSCCHSGNQCQPNNHPQTNNHFHQSCHPGIQCHPSNQGHPGNQGHPSHQCHPSNQCQSEPDPCHSFCGKQQSFHNLDPCHMPNAEDDPRNKFPPSDNFMKNLKKCLSVFDSERLLLITEKMKVVYVLEDCNQSFSTCPDPTVRDVLKRKMDQTMGCMRAIDDRLCEFEDRRANCIADNLEKFSCPCFKFEPGEYSSPCPPPPSLTGLQNSCGPCCPKKKSSCHAHAYTNHHNNHYSNHHSNHHKNHHTNHHNNHHNNHCSQHSKDSLDSLSVSKVCKSINLETHTYCMASIEGVDEIDGSEISQDLVKVIGRSHVEEKPSPESRLTFEPDLTREGLEFLLQHIEVVAIGDDNPRLIYRSIVPSLPMRKEIISAANKGSSLWHISPASITMVMTDQLERMVRNRKCRCILTDDILMTRCPTYFKITTMVSSESRDLWQRLFAHMMRVVTSHPIKIETIADLFSPVLIHPSSRMFIQAASLISKLLHGELDDGTYQDTLQSLPSQQHSQTSQQHSQTSQTLQQQHSQTTPSHKLDASNDLQASLHASSDVNKETQDTKVKPENSIEEGSTNDHIIINDTLQSESCDDIHAMTSNDNMVTFKNDHPDEERNEDGDDDDDDDSLHSTRSFRVTSSMEAFSLTQTAAYQKILTESLVSPLRVSDSDDDDDDDIEKTLNQLISCDPPVMKNAQHALNSITL